MHYLENKVAELTLHLPTEWCHNETSPHFEDNGNSNIYNNPGRTANKLHAQFSKKIDEDSLKHISTAIFVGAHHQVHSGFKQRNTAVARDSKHLIAFTWNNGKTPKEDSGTYDTWKKHAGSKIHVSLSSLSCCKGPGLKSFFASTPSVSCSSESSSGDNERNESFIDSGIESLSQSESLPQSLASSLDDESEQKVGVGVKRKRKRNLLSFNSSTKKPKS